MSSYRGTGHTNKPKLLPCPFCGKQPKTYWSEIQPIKKMGFHIECCCVLISNIFKKEAIEAWNTRAK